MRIVCETAKLTDVCLNVQRCIPNKSVMPHLEGILIKTEGENSIELSGFDLDLGITKKMEVSVEREGAVVLNAKTFCEILRHLPEDTVYIDCDEKNICSIKSGEVEYTVISVDPDEYPELPKITEEKPFTVSKKVLKNMIKQTIFAVSVDDSKTVHRGIKFEITSGQIRLIALDGFRLAIRTEFTEYGGPDLSFIVPAKTLSEIIKFIDDEDEFISVSIGRRHIIFNINGYCIISRLLEGEFLDYRSAVPTAKSTVVRVNTSNMIECIERASIIITEKMKSPIKFIFDEDLIKLSAVTALGSASDKIRASIDGKRTEIGFNNRFILDALRSCDSDEILINLNGSVAPAVILPTDGESFLYLILPVRIKT
ncbi:MAG: DNA polymerase III subunit beta [Oscillospiraceae bacterium]|nr:DNA polymerase III subunit beta [Oscillospiraceae bacterium]